ncbi:MULTISPECIES: YybH family protein [Flavobacteriaceae]|uniref:YybH family protein n=1 Tax=Flavobacteriaceae TaxID=49546 RepID=UPI0014914030|nr:MULTISPECIES: DUF4440 domain-containing protein [Allomuricauda]MDC6366842.1 DUF4440 domain-containing protein [Muricauda sp. AC10]
MKNIVIAIFSLILPYTVSGQEAPLSKINHGMLDSIQTIIYDTERSFRNMTVTKGIAEAFSHYAAVDAVINRNNRLVEGKNNIFEFYSHQMYSMASVDWKPQKIEVAQAEDMAYSYGNYIWKLPDQKGVLKEYKGIYFTIWKKQKDGQWKYVWD